MNSNFFNKYLKYKKKYLELKNQVGSSASSSPQDEVQEFLEYPVITGFDTNGFEAGGARGNGYCSIWAVLVGWSLGDRYDLIRNDVLGRGQPRNFDEFKNYILDFGKKIFILELIDENGNYTYPDTDIKFQKWELETMIYQLETPVDFINTIQGSAHFKIMAILLGYQIQVYNSEDNTITKFGDSTNSDIRISTNGSHYHPHNNKKSADLSHFTNRFWWNMQWEGHPIVVGEVRPSIKQPVR